MDVLVGKALLGRVVDALRIQCWWLVQSGKNYLFILGLLSKELCC
jgi:hypothetical protein